MRNASKNTIKRVMRKAHHDQTKEGSFFYPQYSTASHVDNSYFLFNQIGAQIYRMSKGKICNRGLIGLKKYQ